MTSSWLYLDAIPLQRQLYSKYPADSHIFCVSRFSVDCMISEHEMIYTSENINKQVQCVLGNLITKKYHDIMKACTFLFSDPRQPLTTVVVIIGITLPMKHSCNTSKLGDTHVYQETGHRSGINLSPQAKAVHCQFHSYKQISLKRILPPIFHYGHIIPKFTASGHSGEIIRTSKQLTKGT